MKPRHVVLLSIYTLACVLSVVSGFMWFFCFQTTGANVALNARLEAQRREVIETAPDYKSALTKAAEVNEQIDENTMHTGRAWIRAVAWSILPALAFYLIPLAVAFGRSHRDVIAIGVLNVLGGGTGLGWVGALVWAAWTPESMRQARQARPSRLGPTAEYERAVAKLARARNPRPNGDYSVRDLSFPDKS